VPDVVGEVDRGHAAPAQLALDAVVVGQPCLELFGYFHDVGLWKGTAL
jgi:hypothetical protein